MKINQMTMNRQKTLKLFLLLFLLITMTVSVPADLSVGHCESDCEQECNESCENCGDCIDCQRTMPMMVDHASSIRNEYNQLSWLLPWVIEKISDLYCGSIEHPPQLA